MRPMTVGMAITCFLAITIARAEDQTWNDSAADNVWSTNSANWVGGAVWTNGNSAVFAGAGGTITGETVDVSATVTVANVTFQTNGYVIADANGDGSLSFVGGPSVLTVANAADTGTVSAVIGGVGFTKAGPGVLCLMGNNTFTGVVRVASGILRLTTTNNALTTLGAGGTGNGTVVEDGATLDANSAWLSSGVSEDVTISGSGVGGIGALVNLGPVDCAGKGPHSLTLAGDATVGGTKRFDFSSFVGNGHKLTKAGSMEMAVLGAVNGSPIEINAGSYVYQSEGALGGTTTGNTTINGGKLNIWGSYTIPERIVFNGGSIGQGWSSVAGKMATMTGNMTLNSNVVVNSTASCGIEFSSLVDGLGGLSLSAGWLVFTCDTNSFSGPTTVGGGTYLWIGKTNLYSGVLGSETVTNIGTLYGYSSLIAKGSIVNSGTLNSYTGLLCSGNVVNGGTLYFDRSDALTLTNAFSGTGSIYLRYGPSVTFSGNASTNGTLTIGTGSLSLTNNAYCLLSGGLVVADRTVYSVDQTNVMGFVNVSDGCTLVAKNIICGNQNFTFTGGSMTGTLNQAGGSVYTTGVDTEGNGIKLSHWPAAYCVYNMKGGTLTVGADYDLCCATDGKGWFNMTGGQVFATRVMLKERTDGAGFGRLTVAGGVLNVGSLNANIGAVTNAITSDSNESYYRVEYGGAGGIVRAVTNLYLPLNATLYGTGTNAVTFDSSSFALYQSGNLSGTGGLNKAGSGTLVLSGTNTYAGGTRILEGTVRLASGCVGPTGTVAFAVSTNGVCGLLTSPGDLSLAGMAVAAANPELLDTGRNYTIASWSGSLTSPFGASALPGPWYVYYDWADKTAQLRAAIGTMIRVR